MLAIAELGKIGGLQSCAEVSVVVSIVCLDIGSFDATARQRPVRFG